MRRLSYRDLHRQVCRFANALKDLGVGKGDLVALYIPMVPEAAITMLARLAALHSIVFGGFRKDKAVPLKPAVDEALADAPAPVCRTWWCAARRHPSP